MALYYGNQKVCPTFTTGATPTGTTNITENGTYNVTNYASANVNVQPDLQSKTTTVNGTVTPDTGYDGLSSVVVNVSQPSGNKEVTATTSTQTGIDITDYATLTVNPTPSQNKTTTVNGTITPDNGKLLSSVVVDVPNGTETKNITENGTYTPTNPNIGFSSVTVNVPSIGGVGIPREVSSTGVYQMPTSSFTFSLPSNATSIGQCALRSAFYGCTSLTSVDLSNLITVNSRGMDSAFYGCTSLTSVDLSNLTTLSGYNSLLDAFHGCTSLTSVDLSSLTTSVSYGLGYAFYECTNLTSIDLSGLTTLTDNSDLDAICYGCSNLTSIDLSNLTTVSAYYCMAQAFYRCSSLTSIDLSNLSEVSGTYALNSAFYGCTSLTSVDLSSLANISNSGVLRDTFSRCTSLTTLSFPALTSTSFGSYTNQFNRMLEYVTGCTVHFPSNLQSVIGSWSDVTAGFGGTNTTVLFDLPATT